MKTYQTGNIRNVVLLGSSKSGKTTLSEAMMFEGKVIDRRGTVEAKNTISDNTEIEQINQRSLLVQGMRLRYTRSQCPAGCGSRY